MLVSLNTGALVSTAIRLTESQTRRNRGDAYRSGDLLRSGVPFLDPNTRLFDGPQ